MVLLFLIGIALITVVAVQESKGEGLGSIGGGARLFTGVQRLGREALLDRLTAILGIIMGILAILLVVVP